MFPGVDAPGKLFSLLSQEFHFRKAALLCPEPTSGDYVNAASEGFDTTTRNRLRISSEIYGQVFTTPFISDPSPLQSFFSRRELDSLEGIGCVAFGSDPIRCLVLVAQASDLETTVLDVHQLARETQSSIDRLFPLSSEEPAAPATEETELVVYDRAEMMPILSEMCAKASQKGERVFSIRLDFAALGTAMGIRPGEPAHYRVRSAVSRVLGTKIGHHGYHFSTPEGTLIAAYRTGAVQAPLLLRHHISAALRPAVSPYERELDAALSITVFPEEAADAEALVL